VLTAQREPEPPIARPGTRGCVSGGGRSDRDSRRHGSCGEFGVAREEDEFVVGHGECCGEVDGVIAAQPVFNRGSTRNGLSIAATPSDDD